MSFGVRPDWSERVRHFDPTLPVVLPFTPQPGETTQDNQSWMPTSTPHKQICLGDK